MVVAPVTVMLEKLLFRLLTIKPLASLPLSVKSVTVPPPPVLANPVTIELLFTFLEPPAGPVRLLLINVTLPVVLTDMFVNVLLLIVVNWLALATLMKVIAPDAVTVCPKPVKLLLLTFTVLVVLAEPDG